MIAKVWWLNGSEPDSVTNRLLLIIIYKFILMDTSRFFSDCFDDRVVLLDIEKKCTFSIEWPIDEDVKSKN